MTRVRVGLVRLGDKLPFDVRAVAAKLNRLQSTFRFENAGSIDSELLGAPDLRARYFDLSRLRALLDEAYPSHYSFVIGVTNVRITDMNVESADDEMDYFSQSDFRRVAILTVNSAALRHKPASKTTVQYAAMCIICELTLMTAQTDLMHDAVHECAFNDCEDRNMLAESMSGGRICSACLAQLKAAAVPDNTLDSIRRVLSWCSATSWEFAVLRTLQSPFAGLFLGVGLGWFVSRFFDSESYFGVLVFTLLPLLLTLYAAKTSHD